MLRQHQLYGKLSKCAFFQESVEFLGHIVSAKGIATDEMKMRAICEWPTPTNVHDIQAFLGLCNYYHRFVDKFAEVAALLMELLHKEKVFMWGPTEASAFAILKG